MDSINMEQRRLACEVCGTEYSRVRFGIGGYGSFAYQSRSGTRAFLFALEDPVFGEVKALLDDVLAQRVGKPLREHERHGALLRALALTVDPAPSGEEYFRNEEAPCPCCGSTSARLMQNLEEHRGIDVPAVSVTHRRWEALSHDEKRARIRSVIEG
jgi:hypothetical protein